MHQAVEKFGKSILATLEDYTEEDLRKIGHKLVDFLVKTIKEEFDEIANINVEMEQNLRKLIDRFQTDYKKKICVKVVELVSHHAHMEQYPKWTLGEKRMCNYLI